MSDATPYPGDEALRLLGELRTDGPVSAAAQVEEAFARVRAEAVDAAVAAADAKDPLRALLADEDRALEFAARVRYEAVTGLPGSWDEAPDWSKAKWIAGTTARLGPVLAALREVAGL